MSALDHLRALARGEVPADDGLLGNARCAWAGGELVGEETVLAACRTHVWPAAEAVAEAESETGAALFGASHAMFADVYGGRIGRLWRIGETPPMADPAREPHIDVAFDPDLSQLRADIFMRTADHPGLTAQDAAFIGAAAKSHLAMLLAQGDLRARAWVIRAFRSPQGTAALLAVHRMGNEYARSVASSYTAIMLDPAGHVQHLVADPIQPRNWTPRF